MKSKLEQIHLKHTHTTANMTTKLATFGMGCFWGSEAAFRKAGFLKTAVGYSGGSTPNATYKQVCTGTTGHAEVVQIEYDPATTSFDQLLSIFWNKHNPTQLNRQGPDHGTQYRSAVFYHDEEQKAAAEKSKKDLLDKGVNAVTEISPFKNFYAAEDYHQQYFEKNPSRAGMCH